MRNIGISNFSIKKTQEVLSFCRIRPAVNQVGHPWHQQTSPACPLPLPFFNSNLSIVPIDWSTGWSAGG